MKTATLGEVAEWGSGGTPKRSVAEYFGAGTPWLSIADLNDDVVTESKEELTAAGISASTAKVVPKGTILVAMYGSIGKLGVAGRDLCTSQAIAFAKPDSRRIDTRYMFHYLLSERSKLQARGRGGTQMNIGQADLKAWPVPLPPLEEQRRIAATLDAADSLRTRRRIVSQRLGELRQSVYRQFFDERVDNSAPLGTLAEKVVVGHVGPTSPYFRDTGIPLIRTGNIGQGEVIRENLAHVTPEFHQSLPKSHVRGGDVLISRVISDEVRGAIVPDELDGANCANVIIVRPSDDLLATTIIGFLGLPETQSALLRRRVGSAQGVVNTSVLKELSMPLYGRMQQRELANSVRGVALAEDLHRRSLDGLEQLFESLQSRSFRGER